MVLRLLELRLKPFCYELTIIMAEEPVMCWAWLKYFTNFVLRSRFMRILCSFQKRCYLMNHRFSDLCVCVLAFQATCHPSQCQWQCQEIDEVDEDTRQQTFHPTDYANVMWREHERKEPKSNKLVDIVAYLSRKVSEIKSKQQIV